jgi:hypothetical protein
MVVFTRYLYSKEDVEIALLGSLLKKDKSGALFWVYELYFSGFWEDTKKILWKIYYSLYATQNVQLETYMKKKEEKIINETDQETFLHSFVSNLVIRKSSMDVFILAGVSIKTERDDASSGLSFSEKLELQDYEAICHDIFDIISQADDNLSKKMVNELTRFFKSKGCDKLASLKKYDWCGVSPLLILIARVMTMFTELACKDTNTTPSVKKNLYVSCKKSEIDQYRTREIDYGKEKPCDLFRKLVTQTPYTDGILSVFKKCDDEITLRMYRQDWMAYAFESTPIWRSRIEKYGGSVHEGQLVWQDEDMEEEFFERYEYNTDEQSSDTQRKNIPHFEERMSLAEFHTKFKGCGIYEPCDEILEALID